MEVQASPSLPPVQGINTPCLAVGGAFFFFKNHENKIERTSWIGDATLEEAGPGL
jgi:hypothetical protein